MGALLKNVIARCDKKLRLDIDRMPKDGITELPTKLYPFIWYFIRQVKGPTLAIAVTEGLFAVLISVMFWYVGALVEQGDYGTAMLWLGGALLLVRFVTGTLAEIFYHLIYIPYVCNVVRHQLYWYTARQPLSFFQNDFAGRIANKLQQTGPSLRDAIKSTIGAVWFAVARRLISDKFAAFSANVAIHLGIYSAASAIVFFLHLVKYILIILALLLCSLRLSKCVLLF